MRYILFLLILLCGIVVRFYLLGVNPPSLTWDETAWGYNAYALSQDEKDEFGRFLPYDYLESFGDYKPPLYAYAAIFPVKLFGLTEFATRFPSAFFGVLTVFVSYFLIKEIFYPLKEKEKLGLLGMGILAISPWHIMLSRAAFEANVASFFLVFGCFLFLLGKRRYHWMIIISFCSFLLSLYTFNSERIVSPLFILVLIISFRKFLISHTRVALVAFLFAGVLLLPILKFLFSSQASLRFREVNIFSDISVVERINQEVQNDQESSLSKLIHNRRITYAVEYLRHYFDNLDPNFLFIKGDGNPRFSIQDVGELYIWEAPFLLLGIFFLCKKKEGYWWIIPVWLFLGIIPAASARETPHALRTEAALPTFQILTAYGLLCSYTFLKRFKYLVIALLSLIIIFNFVYFLHGYFLQYPILYSHEWQYGYKESIAYVKNVENKYNHIVMTTDLGRPYIYYLFYLQIPPETFRRTAKISRDPFGFVSVNGFDKFIFSNSQTLFPQKYVLYIATANHVPSNASIQKTFYLLDGEPSLVAYTL